MKKSIASILTFVLSSLLNAQVSLDWARCGLNPSGSVQGASFTPDGERIFINDFYGVKEVDAATGNLLRSVYDDFIVVGDPWVSADMTKLRYGVWRATMDINLATGQRTRTTLATPRLSGYDRLGSMGFFAFSRDGSSSIFSVYGFNPAIVYDVTANAPKRYLDSQNVQGADFSADGRYAIVPGFSTYVCDARTGALLTTIPGFAVEAHWCNLVDRNWVSVGRDIYDIATTPPTLVFTASNTIKFSPSGDVFGFWDNGEITVYDTRTRQRVGQAAANHGTYFSFGSQTGTLIIGDRDAWTADWRTNTVLSSLADFMPYNGLSVSGDGSRVAFRGSYFLANGTGNGLVFLDGKTGKTLSATPVDPTFRETHSLSYDGSTLLELRENPFKFIAYDTTTGAVRSVVNSPLRSLPIVCISPDGKQYAVTYSSSSRLDVYDSATGQLLKTKSDPGFDGVASMAWSPDGEWLALGLLSQVQYVNATSLSIARTMEAPFGSRSRLAFDKLGAHIYRTSFATTYKVTTFDLLRGSTTTIDVGPNEVSIAPDGRRYVTYGDAGDIVVKSILTGLTIYAYSDPFQTLGLVRERQFAADGLKLFVTRSDGPVLCFNTP